MEKTKYSVIIISYNEEANIEKCIRRIKDADASAQIILSDGGSDDLTVSIASEEGATVVSSRQGRGVQCNSGARYATGEILLFLHADTVLPQNAFNILDDFFRSEKVKIGTFRLSFSKKNNVLKFYSMFTSIDSIYTSFGDQCIVTRKDFYDRLKGFKDWPIFEDVDILRRARKETRIFSFPAYVITSSRRFEKTGLIKQQLLNFLMIVQFLFGKSPNELALMYNKNGTTNRRINNNSEPVKELSLPVVEFNNN